MPYLLLRSLTISRLHETEKKFSNGLCKASRDRSIRRPAIPRNMLACDSGALFFREPLPIKVAAKFFSILTATVVSRQSQVALIKYFLRRMELFWRSGALSLSTTTGSIPLHCIPNFKQPHIPRSFRHRLIAFDLNGF